MNSKYLIFFVLLFFIASCQKQKSVSTKKKQHAKNEIAENQDFDYLKVKSKVNYENGEQQLNGKAHIRLEKDKRLWVSLTPGLGIEAARCLITKDSLFLMDKINNKYKAEALSQISEKLHFDINFNTIQAFFLGNLPFEQNMEQSLDSVNGSLVLNHSAGGSSAYKVFVNQENRKIEKINVINHINKAQINASYNTFKQVKKLNVPYSNKIKLTFTERNNQKHINLNFDHKEVEIEKNPLSFPFNVPDSYKE